MMQVMHLLPSLESGGVEQVVLELCEGLQPSDVQNTVISGGGQMVAQIEATGAKHITLPIGKKSPLTLWQIFRLRRILCSQRVDILHVHSRVPAWVARLCLKLLPRKKRPLLISSFHGFHSVNRYSGIMAKGDAVIAVSQCMREHILTHYKQTPADDIVVIPNSVNTEQFNPDFTPSEAWWQQWRSDYPELQGKYVLCLPGRITRLKGAAELIPILLDLHEKGIPAHALIVGDCKKGKEAYKQKLINSFDIAGLSEHVSWTGHRSDLREIFCASNVVLSLSTQPESFGKTTLEALALCRPVAGYAHGGVGEQLDIFLPEGKIKLGDSSGMAQLLAQWYKKAPQMHGSVLAPFRREDMISAHLNLYNILIEDEKATHPTQLS